MSSGNFLCACWKLAVVRATKRKKKSTKRIQESVKKNQKKRSKENGKRSTLKSLPSFEFESIILLHFTIVPVSIQLHTLCI